MSLFLLFFERADKAAAYREAREAASQAVFELVLARDAQADALVTAIEQELMATLAGLLRRMDKKRNKY